jgi:hypothetical protein
VGVGQHEVDQRCSPGENGTRPRSRSLQVTDKPKQLLQCELAIPFRFVLTSYKKRTDTGLVPERKALSANFIN